MATAPIPRRVPPPPSLAGQFPELNKWLIDLTAFISASGGVDPSGIPGYAALVAQVALNTTHIVTLQGQVSTLSSAVATNTANIATNTANIATNTANIATNTTNIATSTANIATLTARAQVLNGTGVPGAGLGNNGDLYLNNTGGAGTRLYGKIAAAWVAIA